MLCIQLNTEAKAYNQTLFLAVVFVVQSPVIRS